MSDSWMHRPGLITQEIRQHKGVAFTMKPLILVILCCWLVVAVGSIMPDSQNLTQTKEALKAEVQEKTGLLPPGGNRSI